jgi:hypothetical protein
MYVAVPLCYVAARTSSDRVYKNCIPCWCRDDIFSVFLFLFLSNFPMNIIFLETYTDTNLVKKRRSSAEGRSSLRPSKDSVTNFVLTQFNEIHTHTHTHTRRNFLTQYWHCSLRVPLDLQKKKKQTTLVALVLKRTMPTERQPLVGEVSANF